MRSCASLHRSLKSSGSPCRTPPALLAAAFLSLFAAAALTVGTIDPASAADHRRGPGGAARSAAHPGGWGVAGRRAPFPGAPARESGRDPGHALVDRSANALPAQPRVPPSRSFQDHAIQDRYGGFDRNPAGLDHQRVPGMARNGLPSRPFPGEAGFTGVPPRGETRFIFNEMVVHVPAGVSQQTLNEAARRLGLTTIASENLAFTGGTLVHFRIGNGQQVADVVRALENERIGIAQPNYVYQLQQDIRAETALPKGDPAQYVIGKLQLANVHQIASGNNVLVAVIDSRIDTTHPDLSGSIVGQFDAVDAADKPDEHGTGMAGAIAAHRKLLGVAPRARLLAIHAFSPNAQTSAQATTQNIVAGIDWAIQQGARIINMSFAGPYDPMLQLALKKAHDRGVVLIAAAGNMGPQSPPLYPAADENVIAVTAVDENEKLLPQANQGPHIALAAPGVNILEAAPRGTYSFTTGTSVAAAHVTGVAALIIERNPAIDSAALEDILSSTAKDLGPPGRDSQFGFGLVDPYRALNALEAKLASNRLPPPALATASPKLISVATTSEKLPDSQMAVSRSPEPTDRPAFPGATSANSKTSARALAPGPGKLTISQLPSLPNRMVAIKPADAPSSMEKRRLACRQEGLSKGLHDPAAQDYADTCVADTRVACLRQAIAQNIREPERRNFINRCLEP